MATTYKRGDSDIRPWGTWTVLDVDAGFCVKRIVVNPGQSLSLQMHQFRDEHWIIVSGDALVTRGDDVSEYASGTSVFIPAQTRHRIKNKSDDTPMVFIEVQTGATLDETDIIRFADDYGRVN